METKELSEVLAPHAEGASLEKPGGGVKSFETKLQEGITPAEIEAYLTTSWAGRPVKYFREIDSTNDEAKRLAAEGAAEGTLVVADSQTKGKGRSGREWSMKPGSAVAMSLLLRPELPPERISMVTLVMGLAAAKVCRRLYRLPAMIKWPNDVVVNGRKLCGILTELGEDSLHHPFVVIGVGINVNETAFPEKIRDVATSLQRELGEKQNRARLIAECIREFEKLYGEFLKTKDLSLLTDTYEKLLVNRGRTVRVLEPGNEYEGTALGISARGELLVRGEDGTVKNVYAGEVSVRGVYGYV